MYPIGYDLEIIGKQTIKVTSKIKSRKEVDWWTEVFAKVIHAQNESNLEERNKLVSSKYVELVRSTFEYENDFNRTPKLEVFITTPFNMDLTSLQKIELTQSSICSIKEEVTLTPSKKRKSERKFTHLNF